jgi:hypothetical protein
LHFRGLLRRKFCAISRKPRAASVQAHVPYCSRSVLS